MNQRWSFRWGASAVALGLALIVAACSGSDVLGPPDGTACTVGTVQPGDSVNSAISSSSCLVWSDLNGRQANAESWTLNAKAHTAYVVWVYHTADTAAFDNWDGDLWLYGRNDAGDATFATGWWDTFGSSNGNGGDNQELIFTTTKDRTLSLRVEARNPGDTGHYALVVHACPAPDIAAGDTSAVVAVDSSCVTKSVFGDAHTAFWTFHTDSTLTTTVGFTKTAGDAWFHPWVTGEGLNVGCYGSYCTWSDGGNIQTSTTLSPSFDYSGDYTALASVHTDSTASLTATITTVPITAPHPTPTRPAFAGRHR